MLINNNKCIIEQFVLFIKKINNASVNNSTNKTFNNLTDKSDI